MNYSEEYTRMLLQQPPMAEQSRERKKKKKKKHISSNSNSRRVPRTKQTTHPPIHRWPPHIGIILNLFLRISTNKCKKQVKGQSKVNDTTTDGLAVFDLVGFALGITFLSLPVLTQSEQMCVKLAPETETESIAAEIITWLAITLTRAKP